MRSAGTAIALVLAGLVALPLSAAATQTLCSVSRDDDQLRIIDPADGSTVSSLTMVIQGSTISGANGLASHPQNGVLYGLVRLSTGFPPDRWLVKINPTNGGTLIVGNTGAKFASLAFDSAGTLYAVTGKDQTTLIPRSLYTLSLTDASPTFVTTLVAGGGALVGGEAIAFNPSDGFLYHAWGVDDEVINFNRVFEKINLTTLVATNIPISGDHYSEITALVFDGSVFLGADTEIGTEGEILLSLTDAGVASEIGSTDHVAKGLAICPNPIPGLRERGRVVLGTALLILTLATLAGRRWQQGRLRA